MFVQMEELGCGDSVLRSSVLIYSECLYTCSLVIVYTIVVNIMAHY